MKINNLNYQEKPVTFGYKLPKYCDCERTILTEDFINKICQEKRAQGPAVYERYIQALENFKNKKFNAEPLYNFYKPRMREASEPGLLSPLEYYVKNLYPPTNEVMEKKQITCTKKTPFRNFLNLIQGKPERNKQITKNVKVPKICYDLSKIDASVFGVKHVEYGGTLPGEGVGYSCYEIQVHCGMNSITMERFDYKPLDASEADKRLQEILSNPDELDKFGTKITESLEEEFKSWCNYPPNKLESVGKM